MYIFQNIFYLIFLFLCFRRTEHAMCESNASLEGKTVIVTGGNSGIGKESCRDFIKRGGRVIMACRSTWKGEDAKKDIENDTGIYNKLIVMNIDLSSMKSVRNFADQFKKSLLNIVLNIFIEISHSNFILIR